MRTSVAMRGVPGDLRGQQAIAYLIFALIGTLGVGIPVGIYFVMGARSEETVRAGRASPSQADPIFERDRACGQPLASIHRPIPVAPFRLDSCTGSFAS